MRARGYRFGEFLLDVDALALRRGESVVRLQPKTFDVLLYLLDNPGRLVSKQELLDAVWPGVVVTENSLTRCIKDVRRALDDDVDAPRYVETLARKGYRFLVAPELLPTDPPAAPARGVESVAPATAPAPPGARPARRARTAWAAGAVVLLAGLVAWLAWQAPWRDGADAPATIAVLPFTDLSDDEGARYFADGVAEDLLDLLSRTPGLQVAARTSAFAFRDTERGTREIADALGVRWLLLGSVRREGDVARVSVQLVDADSGFQAWSSRYDRPLTQLLETQDEIAGSVLAQVAPRLAASAVPRADLGTRNFEAYQSYMLGRDFLNRRPRGWAPQALAAYRRAIELDPRFGRAYGGIALVNAIGLSFVDSRAPLVADATAAARKALELEPDLGLAHAALGVLALQQDDGARAEPHLRRALALDPQLTAAHAWLAGALLQQGRHQDARRELEAGLQRDPLNPLLIENYGGRLAEDGDYEGARAAFERLLALPLPASSAYAQLRGLALTYGRLADALRWSLAWEQVEAQRWPVLRRIIPLGTYARLGDVPEVEARIAALGDGPLDSGWLGELELPLRMIGRGAAYARLVETRLEPPAGPPALRHTMLLGRARALAGDWPGAAERLVPAFPADRQIGSGADGGAMRIDSWLWLVHALRQTRRAAEADAQLRRLDGLLAAEAAVGIERSPDDRYLQALVAAVAGRDRDALIALEAAVDGGFAAPGLLRHEPRWGRVATDPAFAALLARVDDRVAAERREVERRRAAGEFGPRPPPQG